MAITLDDVDYVAKLAKLQLADDEKEDYAQKLNSILHYMEQLQDIDTKDTPTTTHVLPLENVFREDELKEGLSLDKALANAPDTQDGYFKVPKIM